MATAFHPGRIASGRTHERAGRAHAGDADLRPRRTRRADPDRATIHADGRDLSFVTVSVVDEKGIPVPDAEPIVHLRLDGGATIAGVDNGDEIGHERFQRDSVRLFA